MAVKPDRWIRRMSLEHKMIEPFTDRQVREGVISYGVSSYGYDIRVADEFRIFTNVNSTIVDPKHFDPKSFVEFKGEVCIIPPNSFGLGRSVEYFRIPRNVLTLCVGKSTYARCGIIVNVTPFEPEWEGFVTLEISNTTPLPAKIYANEGLCQVIFFLSDEDCEVSYKDKKGKYQAQGGIVLPRLWVGFPAIQRVAQEKKRVQYSSRPAFLFSNRVRDVDHRVAAFAPGIEATLQGPDSFDPVSSEEQRHTGAGGFVRSSTVENHFAFARQAVVFFFQLLGVHAKGAGNGFGIGFEIHGMAQVDDDKVFAGVDFLFQLVNA